VVLPVRFRILLWSLLSGVLWALAWPAVGGLAPLALIAWLPLLHAERLHDGRGTTRAFVPYVLPAVFLWNVTCSWWFYGVSEPLATKLVSVIAPVVVNTLLMTLPWWLKRIVRRSVGTREAGYGFILFWLAYERLHHAWDLQWPWFSIGNVFANDPSLIQWYSVTGMLGGTLWVLVVNLLLDGIIAGRSGLADRRTQRLRIIALVSILVLPITASLWRYHTHVEEGRPVEVVVVQPNIDPYSEKFGGVDPLQQLDDMLALAASRTTERTALVVMPETALQEPFNVDLSGPVPELYGLWENDLSSSRSAQRIRAFQLDHPGVAVITGMSSAFLFPRDAELPLTARALGQSGYFYESYNAAMFLPSAGPIEQYHKSKLVTGAEAMPFRRVLGSLEHLALDLGGTTGSLGQQSERSVLRDPTTTIAVVPTICYESVFGEHVAAHVRNGGNLIAIMTNDAWWGDTPGYKQHLSFARIRAIETRRAIARSANTGISCFVDQRGDLHELTEWWVPDARRRDVYLNERITWFVRYGDVIGRTAVLFAPLLLLLAIVRGIRGLSGRR
jgi:apolipoprotein N-acyltransferase